MYAQKQIGTKLIDSVSAYICEVNIKHPEIVMRQAIFETGWFKSDFLMKKNNLFGFRVKNYMQFDSWKESVDYYKKWQSKYYIEEKYKDYYDFLTKIKYGNKRYVQYLKSLKHNLSCD